MAPPKKQLRKSITLGEPGHPARIIAEAFIREKGSGKYSEWVRKMHLVYASNRPEFDAYKAEIIAHDIQDIKKKMARLAQHKALLEDELAKYGIDARELFGITDKAAFIHAKVSEHKHTMPSTGEK